MIKIEIQQKIARSLQRIADWQVLRDSKDCQMGPAYVDMQLQWENDRLRKLRKKLEEVA